MHVYLTLFRAFILCGGLTRQGHMNSCLGKRSVAEAKLWRERQLASDWCAFVSA